MKVLRNTYVYMDRFIRREINYHLVRPTNLLGFLTYRCTSRCRSCIMWKRNVQDEELSLGEWKSFVDTLGGYAIRHAEIFGGDALLRKDVLIPLIAHLKSSGIREVDMPTNCNLLDDEAAGQMVGAGLDTVYTSLDGVGALHDRVRGVEGSFARTSAAIRSLARARGKSGRPRIVINCTVSALNVDGVEHVLSFAEDSGADAIAYEYVGEFPGESLAASRVEGCAPDPYYVKQERSILLSREQAAQFKEKVRVMREKARTMRVHFNSRNIDILTVDEMSSGMMSSGKCYVCRYLITVDPYGNVLPCPFFAGYRLGNIRERHVREIWNNERHRTFLMYADTGRISMCRHCILSVERNPSFLQSVKKAYLAMVRRGYDE